MDRIVIKVGGSLLFGEPLLTEMLRSVFDEHPTDQLFLIVGGGEIIEGMRTLHRTRRELNDIWVHWQCIDLLDTTWKALGLLIPEIRCIGSNDLLDSVLREEFPSVSLVRVGAFYTNEFHDTVPIQNRPRLNWETTTDSIAWLLANHIDASQLILLKSCDVGECSFDDAVRLEIIDPGMSRLASLNPRIRVLIRKLGA